MYILPKLDLQTVLGICNIAKIYVFNPDDNYLPHTNICIYCRFPMYVGRELIGIPGDIRTYSIRPEDFELYEKHAQKHAGGH